MPVKIIKGSQEAKAWGERMRGLRKGGNATKHKKEISANAIKEKNDGLDIKEIGLETATVETAATEPEKKKRKARLAKGSDAAKEHMAKIRGMRKGNK